MPNKYTAAIDAASPMEEDTFLFCESFDAIFGKWTSSPSQCFAWNFLWDSFRGDARETKCLFFCFLAELSDKDLEECFPEIFPLASSS